MGARRRAYDLVMKGESCDGVDARKEMWRESGWRESRDPNAFRPMPVVDEVG